MKLNGSPKEQHRTQSLATAIPIPPRPWALAHAGGLLALASCVSLARGMEAVDALDGEPWLPRDYANWVQFGAAVVVAVWLTWTVISRTDPTADQVSPRRPVPQRLGFASLGVAFLYVTAPAASKPAVDLGGAVYGCALAWLAAEVCRRHGVTLRPGFLTSDAQQRRQVWNATKWAFVACLAGGLISAWLSWGVRSIGIDVLVVGRDQQSILGIENVGSLIFAVVRTVAIEDVVIVAGVTTLLAAARRPAWQIYTAICLIEVLLHAYLGLPALAMAIYAAGRVWLFRRYGCLIALVISHVVYDLVYVPIAGLASPHDLIVFPLLLGAVCFDMWINKRDEPVAM